MVEAIRAIEPVADARLWAVDLDAPQAQVWRGLLSDDEKARAARFVFPLDRARYEAAHGALRHLLSLSASVEPAAIRLEVGPLGKPRLANGPGIEFNLSHSQDLALIAVGTTPLGVDVELLRPFDDWRELAAAHFTTAEQEFISNRPAKEQAREFLRCWTRKEACLKALGLGLSVDTRTVDVRLDHIDVAGHGQLVVHSLTIGARAVASLAFVESPVAPTAAHHVVEACA